MICATSSREKVCAGLYGTWRGLADAQPSDPYGAVEINGELFALPLGDLQRLTA